MVMHKNLVVKLTEDENNLLDYFPLKAERELENVVEEIIDEIDNGKKRRQNENGFRSREQEVDNISGTGTQNRMYAEIAKAVKEEGSIWQPEIISKGMDLWKERYP